MGPTIQFWKSDNNKTFQSLKTRHISSYFTLANGGYIINIKPIAIGIEVVPTSSLFIPVTTSGTK